MPKRNTIEDCHKLAQEKNGKFLSDEYKNAKTKYLWQCEKGHNWTAIYGNIRRGDWCPYCCGNAPSTIKDCHKLAKEKNGKFLSDEYKNRETKHLWQCEKNHQWMATYRNIQKGTWCPKCKTKTQTKLYENIQFLFGESNQYFYNYRKFDWLKNPKTKKNLEIDIVVFFENGDVLGIEYDGEQHFDPKAFNKGKKGFRKTKWRDGLKNMLIGQNKDKIKYFIRFKYDDDISLAGIEKKMKEVGLL